MSTYTPFDNLTDDEFLRWLELNLQDSRKDAIIDRTASDVKKIPLSRNALFAAKI